MWATLSNHKAPVAASIPSPLQLMNSVQSLSGGGLHRRKGLSCLHATGPPGIQQVHTPVGKLKWGVRHKDTCPFRAAHPWSHLEWTLAVVVPPHILFQWQQAQTPASPVRWFLCMGESSMNFSVLT